MIKELFLVCALAAPASNFKQHMVAKDDWLGQFESLTDFINKVTPDAEIRINSENERPEGFGWEKLPFTWNDKDVYIRRPEVSDKYTKRSA